MKAIELAGGAVYYVGQRGSNYLVCQWSKPQNALQTIHLKVVE